MAWFTAYEKVQPYVVRIETMAGFGTGFLFAYNKDSSVAAIATASHVIVTAVDWNDHPNFFLLNLPQTIPKPTTSGFPSCRLAINITSFGVIEGMCERVLRANLGPIRL